MLKEELKMSQFKPGDKVKLKEKFYLEPRFKEMDRTSRKYYANLKGKSLIASKLQTNSCGEYVCVGGDSVGWLRSELLELVEKPKPQITGVWFDECVGLSIGVAMEHISKGQLCKFDPKTGQIRPTPRAFTDGSIDKETVRSVVDAIINPLFVGHANAAKPKPELPKPIEPKVGMWAVPVMDTNPLTGGKRGCSISPYVQGREFRIGRMYVGSRTGNVWLSAGYGDPGIELAACKLLPNYKPVRKWTLDEIREAQAFIGEFFTRDRRRLSYKDYAHSIRGEEILITVDGKRGVAKCCPTDDWNYYIGSMVALSKITGRRLPSWIRSTK